MTTGLEVGQPRPSRWPTLLIAFLYLSTWPFHHGLNNPNEMVRVYMTKALVDQHSFAIDQVIREFGPVDDKAVREDKLYSSKAPLESLLGVPVYLVLKTLSTAPLSKRAITTVLRLFCSAIPGLCFAALLLGFARRRSQELGAGLRAGTAVGLILALGTMLYPYALTFTGHIAAAIAAGGCYLAVLGLSRAEPLTGRWRQLALLAGLGGGAAPFAEYPAALIAGPALLAALWITARAPAPRLRRTLELILWLGLGGLLPFSLGLFAHQKLWGSPFKTGYAFLENRSYVEVHKTGFFGVGPPKLEAFGGALFSPGTGLFFFSPILLIGLFALVLAVFHRSRGFDQPEPARRIPRALALAALGGFVLEVLFISGHNGWRGGWTVGPRYIIPVAPVLGLWVIEALRHPRLRPLIGPLGAVSIAATGYAAALYPHLSDVYTNPLFTFLWPSYRRGASTYGLADSLGLHGTSANLLHLIPLSAALLWVGLSSSLSFIKRASYLALALALAWGGISLIKELDPEAAQRENERLWGFWEPTPPPLPVESVPIPLRPGEDRGKLLFRAYDAWRTAQVEAVFKDGGNRVVCHPTAEPNRCSYGGQSWQTFGPEPFSIGERPEPLLRLHPIKDWVVRARFATPLAARRAILRYGLSDASIKSDNPSPVAVTVLAGEHPLATVQAANQAGLKMLPLVLGSTVSSLSVEVRAEQDGARSFGFDLELY